MMNKKLGLLVGVLFAHNVGASQSQVAVNSPLTTKMIVGKAVDLWENEALDADQRVAHMSVWLHEYKEKLGREAVSQAMNPSEGTTQVPLQEAATSIESPALFKLYLSFHADPLRVYGGRSIRDKLLNNSAYRDAMQLHRGYSICEPFIRRLLAGDFPDVVAQDLKNLVDSKVIPVDELLKALEKIIVKKKKDATLVESTLTEVENQIFAPTAKNGEAETPKTVSKKTRWLHKNLTEPKVSIGQLIMVTGGVGAAGFLVYKLVEKGIITITN